MANTLESVVVVTNLAAGATSANLPHGLNLNGAALIPDYVYRDNPVFTIVSCDDTNLVVRNDGPATASGNFRCLYEYSTQRAYGNSATKQLTPAPFVPGGSTGGSSTFSYIQLGSVFLYSGAADPNTLTLAPVPTAGSMYLRTDGTYWTNLDGGNTGTSWLDTRAAGDSAIFGDGSDGALTVNGTTTQSGTEPLYSSITIGASGVFNTAGRRIFCSGTLTVTSGGVITADGANAVAGAAGAGATAFTLVGGTAGGAGATGAGAAGTNGAATTRIFTAAYGAGGAAGAGSGGAGGAAGTQAAQSSMTGRHSASLIANSGYQIGATIFGLAGGTGGGGGGGDGAAGVGGGGGGGGGVMVIVARRVIATGAVAFRCAGGNGAAGTANNTGGGGGGGGGTLIIVTRQFNGTALVAATHSPPGAGGASGGGAGVGGAAGSAGFAQVFTV